MINEIRKSQLFKGLSEEQAKHMLGFIGYKIKHVKKGETVYHEGDDCTSLGIVIEGKLELQSIFPSGKVIRHIEMGRGNIFGEALLFGRDRTYPVSVSAKTTATIVLLERDRLVAGLMNHPVVLGNYLELISNKILYLNAKIKLLSMDTLRKKIVMFLINQYQIKGSLVIECPMNREQLAENLAIPRPSLSRELLKMQNEGLIGIDKNVFTILDYDVLEDELF